MKAAHLEEAFEAAIESHLLENGWLQSAKENYDRRLGLDPSELVSFLEATQADEWAKYVSLQGGEGNAVLKFAKRIEDEITARGMIDVLRKGIKDTGLQFRLAYFEPAHQLTSELKTLYEANRVTVTRQAHVSESAPGTSVDLLLLINGLPVATAELKTQFTNQSTQDAIKQYREDRSQADLIFRNRTIVNFAFDQATVAMTTKIEGAKTVFRPFNLGTGGPGNDGGAGNPNNPNGVQTSYLWEVVWQRDNWLRLLGSYVHVEHVRDRSGKKTGNKFTIFPRYHQWDAVNKLLATAKAEGPGHNKLVQHSAGSGKSNTIAWLAHGLSRLHTPGSQDQLGAGAKKAGLEPNTPIFDKVIVVTDRKVLDRQLQDTVTSFDYKPGAIEKIDIDSAQLKEALEGKNARIIITTLQKFPVVAETATNLSGSRFAVIIDEAHSSQSGEASKRLKEVLTGKSGDEALQAAEQEQLETEEQTPDLEDFLIRSAQTRGPQANLSFFAFTATPKNKTLQLFGEKVTDPAGEALYEPFHLYSMRQAIEEEYILDVLAQYTTYKTYYRLANNLGEDLEVPKGKAASALARYVSLHPTNLAQKAEIIVEHFRAHTAKRIGGKAKAMVVTSSRLHAVRYYQALQKYISAKAYDRGSNPLRVLVAFSGTVTDPDLKNVEYKESLLNNFSESELPEKFEDEYQILVVAEKYQTGFDQPLLHTMYVDKRLDGVKAVQTLSRLNRTTPGKDDTFVLDFQNEAADIQEAFRPFYTQTTAAPTDPNLLYNLQTRILGSGLVDVADVMAAVEAIRLSGEKGHVALNAAIDPAVERWANLASDDPEKEDFRTAARDFVRAYAFLGQIIPFKDTDLESLYYYCKILVTRLRIEDTSVDLSEAVILTHLRQELVAENQDISVKPGEVVVLPPQGEGRGRKHDEPASSLDELIAALNERFGVGVTDADLIWFGQQLDHLKQDPEVALVARDNDRQQFRVFLEPKADDGMVTRHDRNGELVSKYFGNPDFRNLYLEWVTQQLFEHFSVR